MYPLPAGADGTVVGSPIYFFIAGRITKNKINDKNTNKRHTPLAIRAGKENIGPVASVVVGAMAVNDTTGPGG
jgi:hypothetical protein